MFNAAAIHVPVQYSIFNAQRFLSMLKMFNGQVNSRILFCDFESEMGWKWVGNWGEQYIARDEHMTPRDVGNQFAAALTMSA
jgi:hypothetical protein